MKGIAFLYLAAIAFVLVLTLNHIEPSSAINAIRINSFIQDEIERGVIVLDPPPNSKVVKADLNLIQQFAIGMGVNPIPKLAYSCKWDEDDTGSWAMKADSRGYIIICDREYRGIRPAMRIFGIAHELGHHLDYQADIKTSEPSADQHAVDYLAKIGFWNAIKAKADAQYNDTNRAYRPGVFYAQQVLARAGK